MSQDPDWQAVDLPPVFERQIAFCVPPAERIVAMSYEGLHDIRLGPPVSAATDASHAEDYQIYDAGRLTLQVDGRTYPALGLHGGRPFPTTRDGLSVHVDPERNIAEARDADGRVVIRSDHNSYPPGWLVATFSEDGRLFVVGTPDGLWCWHRPGGQ